MHLSTDQVAAFVSWPARARSGRPRAVLGITEQGVRNRLLALEAQLGVELYRKSRGPRRLAVLTDAGGGSCRTPSRFSSAPTSCPRAFDWTPAATRSGSRPASTSRATC